MRGEALWKMIQLQVAVPESYMSHTDAFHTDKLLFFLFFLNELSVGG